VLVLQIHDVRKAHQNVQSPGVMYKLASESQEHFLICPENLLIRQERIPASALKVVP
jgi:hypothetical protein